MGDDLRFLGQLVSERANQIALRLPKAEGHGSTLVGAVAAVVAQHAADAQTIAAAGASSPAEERVRRRDLLRYQQQLDVLYEFMSRFGSDIGRTDVPIGLLHLVDELIHDLLPFGADPILHLDDKNMYSTMSIFQAVPKILHPGGHPHPHPVAFNVPGLDPGNAMFAPILAHEVGHTSWQQGIQGRLNALLDLPAINVVLQQAVAAGADAQSLGNQFHSWLQEMMCDALAATLTGPSFLFASSVFLPAPAEGGLGSHPYPRDRIAFTLRILERHGWVPLLEELVPDVLDWCRQLAADPILNALPAETALRQSMALAEDAMMDLADDVALNRVTSADFAAAQDELFSYLDMEIPPVTATGRTVGPWLAITACWIHELRQRAAEGPPALPTIAVDPRLNRFLLKSVELAGVVKLWGHSDAPTS